MDNIPIWADHLVAIFVGIVIPVSSIYRNQKSAGTPIDFSTDQKKDFYLSASLSLFILALIVMTTWLLLGRTLQDIGLHQPINSKLLWPLVLLLIALYTIDTLISIYFRSQREKAIADLKEKTPFMPTVRAELPMYFFMCLSAGVFEEIVYRGFLVTYFYYLFSGISYQWLWAIILPAIIFSVSHYYQGTKAVIKIFVFSFLFGYIFFLSGSLLIVMILHTLINATGGLVTVWLIKKI